LFIKEIEGKLTISNKTTMNGC